jgi:CRP/FNR family cyclic AMP-dependent transcriptional regulator
MGAFGSDRAMERPPRGVRDPTHRVLMTHTQAPPELHVHKQCEAFSSVIGETFAESGAIQVKRHAPGVFVWSADDFADRVFTLKTGRIQISSTDSHGREVCLRMVEPGEMFGELCFCSHKTEPRGTDARAVMPSEVFEITFSEFRVCLQRDQRLTMNVLESFCVRLADAEQRGQILAIHNATQRLSRLLLYLSSIRGHAASGGANQVTLTVSHAELASLGAMSRPHVTIVMTRLRRRGLIDYQRGSALKLNVAKLRASLDAP